MAKKIRDRILLVLISLSGLIVAAVLVIIVGYVFVSGISSFTPAFLKSTLYLLLNTLLMVAISLLISVPLSVGSAIFLNEYAKPGKITAAISFATQCLSAIPSIIYGLFGMIFFVRVLSMGFSILAGAFTLAIMVLPTILSTTLEALETVPDTYREGALGLGATKLRMLFTVVLPACSRGIMGGVVLATGRIMGETAALIFTAGTVPALAESLLSSGRTLSVHMYLLAKESVSMGEAYATALLLIIIAIFINWIAGRITRRQTK